MLPSLVFLTASAAITLAPGPDNLYVVTKGITQGRRAALIAATGFASGLSVHTTLAMVGLSALLMASAVAFTCIKILGAAYLVFLGVKALRSHGLISLPASGASLTGPRIFAQAFLMNVLNPKVALLFLAFLPQFTHPELGHLPAQLLVLGACFALIALAIFSLLGIFSSVLGAWVRSSPRLTRALDSAVGVLFILLGLSLALAHRR
jgi:threonine/homoserine/homoserine lactone efflux protein